MDEWGHCKKNSRKNWKKGKKRGGVWKELEGFRTKTGSCDINGGGLRVEQGRLSVTQNGCGTGVVRGPRGK